MQLARIVGNAIIASGHKSLKGQGLYLCQPIDENGDDAGDVVVAVSSVGGGHGVHVIVVADGQAAQEYLKDSKSPVRHIITGIVD